MILDSVLSIREWSSYLATQLRARRAHEPPNASRRQTAQLSLGFWACDAFLVPCRLCALRLPAMAYIFITSPSHQINSTLTRTVENRPPVVLAAPAAAAFDIFRHMRVTAIPACRSVTPTFVLRPQ